MFGWNTSRADALMIYIKVFYWQHHIDQAKDCSQTWQNLVYWKEYGLILQFQALWWS
jgi:hypothetical protein